MKQITIGRSKECDIIIVDESEKTSRKHAVITFTFFGKMRIYDTSSNGTYVNGEKLVKPASMEIKRGDKIEFAKEAELDWNQVVDPYAKMRIPVIFLSVALIVSIGIVLAFCVDYDKLFNNNQEENTEVVADTVTLESDTTAVDAENSLPAATSGAKSAAKNKKAKGGTVKNDASPKEGVSPDNNALKEKFGIQDSKENTGPKTMPEHKHVDKKKMERK